MGGKRQRSQSPIDVDLPLGLLVSGHCLGGTLYALMVYSRHRFTRRQRTEREGRNLQRVPKDTTATSGSKPEDARRCRHGPLIEDNVSRADG